jgi:hypothetical protein
MRTLTVYASSALVLLLGTASAPAADWPMFGRDATRNAVSPGKGAPERWQVEGRERDVLVQPTWNVRWTAELGSASCSSPVIAPALPRTWPGEAEKPGSSLRCPRLGRRECRRDASIAARWIASHDDVFFLQSNRGAEGR